MPTNQAQPFAPGSEQGFPFAYRRRIQWGENDPAGMVFTPRILDYCMEAMQALWQDGFAINWHQMIFEGHVGAPMVHIDVDFKGALRTGDDLVMKVLIDRLGRSSIHYGITGRGADGDEKFSARLVSCMVDNRVLKPVPIPADMRQKFEAYMARCAPDR